MFKDFSIEEFLFKLSSKDPTPGGGSASGLGAAIASSLIAMVAEISYEKGGENKFREISTHFKEKQLRFLQLMDRDSEAFDRVMAAFRLPKNSDFEKEKRKKEIQDSLKEATLVPLEISETIYKDFESLDFMASNGEKNAISDIGVAISFFEAAFEGALYNVYINLKSIKDEDFVRVIKEKITLMMAKKEKFKVLKDRIIKTILE